MQQTFAYRGHSGLVETPRSATLTLAPNLAREPVAFDAALRQPVRFREATSALHDVVVSDLKFRPRDKSAYEDWKRREAERLREVRRSAYEEARERVLAQREVPVPRELDRLYRKARDVYWTARRRYANYLWKHDRDLWRKLMPCDPVITVADDVVFLECFSSDESSYGCLTVDRDGGFGPSDGSKYGTTNVDYSWDLYRHFQSLRTYRETRFRVDPQGFEVATQGKADYREEKIDLPTSWLRGFLQIQAGMCLPLRTLSLSREAVYSTLAWLKRHKAKASPRAVRFELLPGKPPAIVLEPWEKRITSWGTRYDGPGGEPIRIWGRNRLLTLARLLPLIERVDVHLLGTGLPSFWVARMGEMRFTLGLSGWTANDWTRTSALDVLSPPVTPSAALIETLRNSLRDARSADFLRLASEAHAEPAECAAGLNHLAHAGQMIYDLDARRYRWRQILPQALGEAELGPENPELVASRRILLRRQVRIATRDVLAEGAIVYTGEVEGKPVELMIDADHRIRRGQCGCGHHRRGGLRKGPCQHLLALRQAIYRGDDVVGTSRDWYDRLRRWASN